MFPIVSILILTNLLMHGVAIAEDSETKVLNFRAADKTEAIGETGSLYITPPGIFLNPFYDDYFGGTDKLYTWGAKTGLSLQNGNYGEFLSVSERLINPIYQSQRYSPTHIPPIGRYADWLEVVDAFAYTIPLNSGGLKNQFSLGLSNVCNHGGEELQSWFHTLIGSQNSLDVYDYKHAVDGNWVSWSAATAYFTPSVEFMGVLFQEQAELQYSRNLFMEEGSLSFNLIGIISPDYQIALEARYIRQFASYAYDDLILSHRNEMAVGILLFNHYKPTLKYITPYLKGDTYGQLFLDIINFYFPL